MALKLKIPWGDEPLQVDHTGLDGVIREIRESGSPNVVQCDNGDVLVKDFFGECNRVPDVSRYHVEQEDCCVPHDGRYRICNDRYLIPHCNHTEQHISHCDISELSQQELQERGSIVLLLESPHKSEYENRNIARPKKPACGSTGKKIDRCLATVLLHIQEIEAGLIEPSCHVVISNPIQFQTSLHAIHNNPIENVRKNGEHYNWKTLRDNIWRTLWDGGYIKQCFQARLRCYNPKVIINACTADQKDLVNDFVQELQTNGGLSENVSLYKVAHPASWVNLRPERI